MPPLRLSSIGLLLLLPALAVAHVNDRGMDYQAFTDKSGFPCCTNKDCHPAEHFTETVENGREIIRLLVDGVWITASRSFVVGERATDGRAHWCGLKLGTNTGRGWRPGTRCIILPPRVL
jgi:hypothetical protein